MPTAAWLAFFAALALVPDERPLRMKLAALEACVMFAGLCAAWASARASSKDERSFARTPADLPIAAWACAAALFWASSPEPAASAPELARALSCVVAFFAASQTFARMKSPAAALWCFVLAASAAGTAAWHQWRFADVPRPYGTFGNPIFLGQFLAAGAAATFALAAAETRKAPRAALFLLLVPELVGLWLAQSRAALLGLAAALALWSLLRAPRKRRPLLLSGLACAGGWLFFYFRGRAGTHALIWEGAARLWLAHPWLGCGLGRFHLEFPDYAPVALKALWPKSRVVVNYAHNEYLQLLAETGLVGFLVFIAGPLILARKLSAPPEDRRAALADAPALAAASLLAGAAASPDLRFGVSAIVAFAALGMAAGLRLAEWSTWSVVPRVWRGPALAAAVLSLAAWGGLAAQPFLAERAVAKEPAFAAPPSRHASAEPAEPEARGYFYAQRERWPDAIKGFEEASARDPKRPGPLNNLGNVYYTLHDLNRAEAYWRRSVSVAPAQADAHLNLAKLLYERGDLKEAAKHAQAALKARPGDEKAVALLKRMVE